MTPTRKEWRSVPGWEGLYEVSDAGDVRSVERVVVNSFGVRMVYKGRDRVVSSDKDGRRRVVLSRHGIRKTFAIAPLVLTAFLGPPPPGTEACHNDGDLSDDHLDNLRWDTRAENNHDAVRHGRHFSANKTKCPRGHLLLAPNLVPSVLRQGGRTCLACNRAKANVRYAKRTGRDHNFPAWADDHYARIMEATPPHT